MQLLGYSFFFLTTLFYLGLAILNMSSPSQSGNNSMGYGLLLVYLSIGFTVCSLILTIIVRAKGEFAWVSPEAGTRTAVLWLAWLCMSITIFFCSIFKWEWQAGTLYPQFLRWLAVSNGQLWIPLPWLVACLLSLNPDWQAILSLHLFKTPFWVGLSVSALFSGGLLVGYLRESTQRAEAEVATRLDDEKRWHEMHLNEINAHKPDDPIVGLLVFTTRYQPDDVRQAALAKLKAYPDWEAKLLELLANKYYYQEVYSFLGSNPVDHPEAFAQPLNQSIALLSTRIKTDIEGSDNLQDWSFDSYGIGHLLRAIDGQFQGQTVDFYPNVVNVKQALSTPLPERFKGIRFTVAAEVDRWLADHRK